MPDARPRSRPLVRLLRVPAVCTAPADVLAGYAVASAVSGAVDGPLSCWLPWPPLACLAAAGTCLYAGGMALNDYFDRARDADLNKSRPIPAGEVSPRTAAALGGGLLAAGVLFAAVGGWVGGYPLPAVLIAAALAGLVLLYDGPLKATPLAPPTMGACRATNLVLGAAAAPLAPGVLLTAAAMGTYVGGVTLFARDEAAVSRKAKLLAGVAAVNAGFLLLGRVYYSAGWAADPDLLLPLIVLATVAFTVDRRAAEAVRAPGPATVGPAVGVMIISVVTLNAVTVMAATADAAATLLTAALLVPAVLLKKVAALT